MSEINNRAEAKEASIEKWDEIIERIEKIQTDVERMCGFCLLADNKAKKVNEFKCKHCEPDAKKLCEKYITEGGLIRDPLNTAYENTDTLLRKIRSLPVDLK